MNNNMTKAHLRLLRENYENACNSYLLALANMWEWDCKSYGYWIGDNVGGIYAYGDFAFIEMADIIYCVEHNISPKTFNEWNDYCLWAIEFKQTVPNLKSWCMGCPRVDVETQKKLSAMKLELEEMMKDAETKF